MVGGRNSPAVSGLVSQSSTLASTPSSNQTSIHRNYTVTHVPHTSSLVNALRRFHKNNLISEDLNTLVLLYIAKTGQLPIISEKELTEIPKFKFGQYISKMSGFVRQSNSNSESDTTQSSSYSQNFVSGGYNSGVFAKPTSSNASSDVESSDTDDCDEMTMQAWKENFMMHYNHDIKEHESTYKKATNVIIHARKVWKAIQCVIEKKVLATIDEYNKVYGYENQEKVRCESKNCHYTPFTAFRKSIHRRLTTYFQEFPPFTLQRLCELLTMRDNHKQTYVNCGKFMRALDKNLRVNTFWKPVGLSELFEEANLVDDSDANQSDMDQENDEGGSCFNDTASMHSVTRSWNGSKSMMSPRSIGSQSPFHPAESEELTIRDIGPGFTNEIIKRVPSPITTPTSEIPNSQTPPVPSSDFQTNTSSPAQNPIKLPEVPKSGSKRRSLSSEDAKEQKQPKTDDEELDDLGSMIDDKNGKEDKRDKLEKKDKIGSDGENSMKQADTIEHIISREIANGTNTSNNSNTNSIPSEIKVKEQNEDVEIENENEMETDEK